MEQCRDSLDILPAELWTCIAEQSPASWFALCCSVGWLGLYSLDPSVQQKLMDRWVDSETQRLPNDAKHGMHMEMSYYENYTSVVWYRNGNKHRDERDLPAAINYRESGTVSDEAWYRNGVRHRERGDLPAVLSYCLDGTTVEFEAWYRNGKLHRDGDLPTAKTYYLDSILSHEEWHRNGVKHRNGDLPAVSHYYSDGAVAFEQWHRNGVKYRERDFPATKKYHNDGTTAS